jgi:hypothetical protein
MELLDRHQQAVRKHLPLCRQHDFIARYQPQQHAIAPVDSTYWLVLRMMLPSAIIIYAIVAASIAFGPSHQSAAIEATLRAAGVLGRCFHQLCADGQRILSELIADWHSINASLE